MHMGFQTGFAVPAEGSVGKVNMYAETVIKRFPHSGDLLTLCYAVCGNKSCFDFCTMHHLCSFIIPS